MEQAELDEQDVVLPDHLQPSNSVKSPAITEPFGDWPLREAELSYFEKAVLGQIEDLDIEEPSSAEAAATSMSAEGEFMDQESEEEEEEEEEVADAWNLENEDLDIPEEEGETEAPEKEETLAAEGTEVSKCCLLYTSRCV